MKYYSLQTPSHKVSFKEAVIQGIAPDKGLYYPEHIPPLDPSFFERIESMSPVEIGLEVMHPFTEGVLTKSELKSVLKEVLDFDFPVIPLNENIGSLELFHGPTLAFKDVGARFMAHCLGLFSNKKEHKVTVLVATSGDTGGAVANGFLGVAGVEVVILYPSGKVSPIQEKQLTTLGKNIKALEVHGTFDDCQAMVKRAFLDQNITQHRQLTSANSINVARWLPQMLYYFLAYKQLKTPLEASGKSLVCAVPSGNFGNICAGMLAREMGLPIAHFIAATNANKVVPNYMKTGSYQPKKSVATISNAMDVGDPSNFVRILEMQQNNLEVLKNGFSSQSFTDEQTKESMRRIYSDFGYIADPHGAVGFLGLERYQKEHPNTYGVFLETAHPVKFLEVVEDTLGKTLPIPQKIVEVLSKQKQATKISDYQELTSFLLQ
ncbi:threonine synthase [Flavobacteriaceae bacterium LSUCC0859]|nr:threonine synthase [Flavobacteriaceae bacterium LSUCC0859]